MEGDKRRRFDPLLFFLAQSSSWLLFLRLYITYNSSSVLVLPLIAREVYQGQCIKHCPLFFPLKTNSLHSNFRQAKSKLTDCCSTITTLAKTSIMRKFLTTREPPLLKIIHKGQKEPMSKIARQRVIYTS